MRWVWQQVRNPAARYAEANTLLAQDSYDEAVAVVQSIPLDQDLKNAQVLEQQRMIGYVSLLKSAHGDNRDQWHLNADEVDQLQGLRGSDHDNVANWISNLLCAGYGICRAPLTGGEEATSHTKSRKFTEPEAEMAALFYTAPNPAENWVTFNYTFNAPPVKAFVVVRDATGRSIAELPMNQLRGQLVFDTRDLAKGLYAVTYTAAGASLHQDKLIVQ